MPRLLACCYHYVGIELNQIIKNIFEFLLSLACRVLLIKRLRFWISDLLRVGKYAPYVSEQQEEKQLCVNTKTSPLSD